MNKIDFTQRAVSSSALKEAKKSTRDFLWYYNKPKSDASHFSFGNATELYLIDRPEFERKVAIFDESVRPTPGKTFGETENKKWKEKFFTDNADKYIINKTGEESFELIQKIAELVDLHPACDLLFDKDNDYQTTFEWVCPISGLKRSARPDLVNKKAGIIIDIKTYQEDDFVKALVNRDHLLQAKDQIEGALASGQFDEVKAYYWLAISKKAPYHIDFYSYPVGEDLKVEEVYNSVLYRLRDDLAGDDPYSIVYHKAPIEKIKIPNYYK